MKRNRIIFLAVGVLLLALIVAYLLSADSGHQLEDLGLIRKKAVLLINKAGGVTNVCREADAMFQEFGTSKITFLTIADVKNYPAIASLGDVNGIFPGDPTHISIKVGGHMDGFFISITLEKLDASNVFSSNELSISGRIFVTH